MVLPIPTLIGSLTSVIPVLIRLFAVIFRVSDIFHSGILLSPLKAPPEHFDFIVVGGGSAGSAVASRLSEDPTISVLLLEAGGDPNPVTYIPATSPYLGHPEIDWMYRTVPLNGTARASQNQEMLWPRGKSIGGSSNINFMIYNRGNEQDYDRWAALTGDPRWSCENILKYFLRIEDYHGFWDGNGFHSKGGPLRIEPLRYDPAVAHILNAGTEVGLPIRDANSLQTPGFSPLDYTQKRGTRFSTYRAYIKPVKKRKNLTIFRYSTVTKIIFDEDHELPYAVGVNYVRHGLFFQAWAGKEIIVSCGTVASPQLLMLSGVGPKEHLVQHGIRPIIDLPGVGQNLQDHVSTLVGPFLLNQPASFFPKRDLNLKALINYIKDGSGPLSIPFGVATFGLHSTSKASATWPNIIWSVHSMGIGRGLPASLNGAYNTRNRYFRQFLKPYQGLDAIFIDQALGLPKSTGYIQLRDANPFSKPLINPRYYSDPKGEDIQAMLEGIDFILNMFENSTSLGVELGAKLAPDHIPGCELFQFRSRRYWECVLRTLTNSLYHPAGTCRMGLAEDPTTVVDSHLKVKGVIGLRIADASIMPRVTNTNLNAPAIVIGEMCSDLLKETWALL